MEHISADFVLMVCITDKLRLYLYRDYGVRESGENPELCPQR